MRHDTSSRRDFARPYSLEEQPLSGSNYFDSLIEASIPYIIGICIGYLAGAAVFTFVWN